MKKSKFTEAQILFAIKQSETGVNVEEVCRKMGITEATFYNWKKKYGGLGVSELRKLRQLEEDNQQLKKLWQTLVIETIAEELDCQLRCFYNIRTNEIKSLIASKDPLDLTSEVEEELAEIEENWDDYFEFEKMVQLPQQKHKLKRFITWICPSSRQTVCFLYAAFLS